MREVSAIGGREFPNSEDRGQVGSHTPQSGGDCGKRKQSDRSTVS